MKKDIKDYLHLYLNADVRCRCLSLADREGWIARLDVDLIIDFFDADTEICAVMPILRPLSSMTEEEAKGIHSIQHGGSPDLYKSHQFDIRRTDRGFIIIRLDRMDEKLMTTDYGHVYKVIEEDNNKPHVEPVQYHSEIFRYLLEKSFDLFGLIDSGLAINKDELK